MDAKAEAKTLADETRALVAQIRPILAGRDPVVQSVTLADLLAMWIAGHVAADTGETERLRASLLLDHMTLVNEMIPENAKIIHKR